jgi:hypothetical protein
MTITRDKDEFRMYITRGSWEMQKASCLLLFEIREILLNQQQNKDENCHFDKIKELTKEQ